jgi:hypothetical protein
MKNISLLITFVLLMIFWTVTTQAASSFNVNDDKQIDLYFDFSMDILVKNSNYLSYPGSTLKPLTQILVTYRLNPLRFKKIPNSGQHLFYEEIWYHIEQVVGSHRQNNLDIPLGSQGIIRVLFSEGLPNNDKAVADAIVRLLLDLGLKNCYMNGAFIPTVAYQTVISDMPPIHFFFNPPPNIPQAQQISLTLLPNPTGPAKTVYYDFHHSN